MERSIRARAPWQARAAPGLGVLATSLVAVGSCSLSFSHAGAWALGPRRPARVRGRPLAAGGLIGTGVTLLVVAWWLLRPGGRSHPRRPWLLALWALPLVLVPPVLTGDAFIYADGGWILHAGGDVDADPIASLGGPYAPGSMRSGPARARRTPRWPCWSARRRPPAPGTTLLGRGRASASSPSPRWRSPRACCCTWAVGSGWTPPGPCGSACSTRSWSSISSGAATTTR